MCWFELIIIKNVFFFLRFAVSLGQTNDISGNIYSFVCLFVFLLSMSYSRLQVLIIKLKKILENLPKNLIQVLVGRIYSQLIDYLSYSPWNKSLRPLCDPPLPPKRETVYYLKKETFNQVIAPIFWKSLCTLDLNSSTLYFVQSPNQIKIIASASFKSVIRQVWA